MPFIDDVLMRRASGLEAAQGELPPEFLAWQRESRLTLFDRLLAGQSHPALFAAHLPVLATWIAGEPFPNLAAKGFGLVARPERLEGFTRLFETTMAEVATLPWAESLPRRIEAARAFYADQEAIDPCCLGGLEIFEGTTFRYLQANPRASLLYVEGGPRYLSFQIDGIVEIVGEGSPYYHFLHAMRALFEHERFHFQQPAYPWGYIFRVEGVRDKSLKIRGNKCTTKS